MGIQWTPKQIEVYEALQAGKSHNQIVKEIDVTKPIVTKVANAVKNGDYPGKPKEGVIPGVALSSQSNPPKPGTKADQAQVIKQHQIAEEIEKQKDGGGNTLKIEGEGEGEEEEPEVKPKRKDRPGVIPPPEQATVLKLVPVTATVALTPIMQSMRLLCVMELHWSPEMSWEDIIDTCFYHLAKAWGFTLQGYYRDEPDEPINSPKPAGGKPSDNVNGLTSIDFTDAEIKLGMLAAKLITQQAATQMAVAGGKYGS